MYRCSLLARKGVSGFSARHNKKSPARQRNTAIAMASGR
jgi:hypothetical protein